MFQVRRRRRQFNSGESPPPQITNWSPDPLSDMPESFTCTGLHFGPTQGSGKVYLGNASTYAASTTLTEQSVSTWADEQITGTTDITGMGEQAWVYVLTDEGLVNAAGYHVPIIPV